MFYTLCDMIYYTLKMAKAIVYKEKKEHNKECKVSAEIWREWKMHLGRNTWGFKSLRLFYFLNSLMGTWMSILLLFKHYTYIIFMEMHCKQIKKEKSACILPLQNK